MEANVGNNEAKVEWKKEAINGNFMPAIIMLEQNKINVNDPIEENNGDTLLHLAGRYSFYNVILTLIEKFNADINIKNKRGHTLLFLISSSTEKNIVNFNYVINKKNVEIDISDSYGMNPLVHSIMTSFHFASFFFINEGLLKSFKDNYNNPITYFAIANNNKFALCYLIYNHKVDINAKFFNNTLTLSDILISSKYNSITKFICKYFVNQLDLNSINTCKRDILFFETYNVYNYELLNTLCYYKTKDFFGFISALLRKNNTENELKQEKKEKKENNNGYGYYYKVINFRFMLYNLILPALPQLYKLICFFIYFTFIYYICDAKNNELNEKPRADHPIYTRISFILFYINLIALFNFKKPKKYVSKVDKNTFISEIANKVKNNLTELPDIEEICPTCAHIKDLSIYHCFLCGGCIPYRLFHSNLFGLCIAKSNIKNYLLYIILKINIYMICLINALKANPTNNGLICVFFPFWHKTSLKTFILQSIVGGLILIHFGHLLSLLLCLSVKTPYKYIFGMDKRVYYKCLKENPNSKLVSQVPEINDEKKISNIFYFLFKDE